MKLDLAVETAVSTSHRARQLCSMFDVPSVKKLRLDWQADLPLEERPWNVGLIVGPSGAGKSQCARALFGDAVDVPMEWGGRGVVDDFRSDLSIETIANACKAVGFNTIPSWLRPFGVLSNGERFRVELARRMVELPDPVVVDEFSSVVDRQVARIGSHSVAKWARREGRRFVAVTCHYDVVDWLQPDWMFEPATRTFTWRSLQRRPELHVTVCRVPYSAWALFAPFHYLTAELHRSARCFCLFVDGVPAAFAGLLPRAISSGRAKGTAIWGVSRLVTIPDYQGLGLAHVLCDRLGAALRDLGTRVRTYPAHPPLIRSFQKLELWQQVKAGGTFTNVNLSHANRREGDYSGRPHGRMGGRPNAVFEYVGEAAGDEAASRALWEGSIPTRRGFKAAVARKKAGPTS